MTTLATEYRFTAAINSKGKQGNGWKVEFNYQLPGSKYPFVLYGQNFDDIEGWNVGDEPEVVIARGKLKADKDGKYSTDYFYDLVSIEVPVFEIEEAKPPAKLTTAGVVHARAQPPEETTPKRRSFAAPQEPRPPAGQAHPSGKS